MKIKTETHNFDLPLIVQPKQCIKDDFGNNWWIFINETKGFKRATSPSPSSIFNASHNIESLTYSGNIILKPENEGILKKAEEIKISLEMQTGLSDETSFTIFAKHQDNGVFHFCSSPQYNRLVKCVIHIEFPDLKENDLKSSKDHLKKLLETGEFSDVVVKTKSEDINVHKCMLSKYEYYDRMFKNSTKEAQTGVINSGNDYEVMLELMKYIYYEECNLKEFAIDLLIIADLYNIMDLFYLCEKYLINNITMENFFIITKVTEQVVKTDNLKKAILNFFIDNQMKIITSEKWNEFKEDPSTYKIAMDLMEAHAHYIHEQTQNENNKVTNVTDDIQPPLVSKNELPFLCAVYENL